MHNWRFGSLVAARSHRPRALARAQLWFYPRCRCMVFIRHKTDAEDQITAKLPALHFYQLSLPTPKAPPGAFDAKAAAVGEKLFAGKAQSPVVTCRRCLPSPDGTCTKRKRSASTIFRRNDHPTTAIARHRCAHCGTPSRFTRATSFQLPESFVWPSSPKHGEPWSAVVNAAQIRILFVAGMRP
jgi:hypothetical protein